MHKYFGIKRRNVANKINNLIMLYLLLFYFAIKS